MVNLSYLFISKPDEFCVHVVHAKYMKDDKGVCYEEDYLQFAYLEIDVSCFANHD
ncbi:hypothetical protein LINPERHAP1_LOCUS14803 [Linum perenne]